jgi:heme exporter protein A
VVYGLRDIAPALEAYGLGPLEDRLTGTLSAGQRRRAVLARLMVTGRAIWILDEPTVSLDADAVGMFADAVRGHLGAGGMAVLATHIELGLDAAVLDVTSLRAAPQALHGASDEAFL